MTPLRQRMIDDMQLRNLAPATQRNYIHYVAEFAKYFRLSPEVLDLEAVRQYQLHLVNERKLSPQSVNQYVSAVKFLYTVTLEMPWSDDCFVRAHCPSKLPVVLSQEELMQFFDYVPSLKYGVGRWRNALACRFSVILGKPVPAEVCPARLFLKAIFDMIRHFSTQISCPSKEEALETTNRGYKRNVTKGGDAAWRAPLTNCVKI